MICFFSFLFNPKLCSFFLFEGEDMLYKFIDVHTQIYRFFVAIGIISWQKNNAIKKLIWVVYLISI